MGSWRNVGAIRRLQALDKVWVHDVTLGGRGCVSGLLMKAGFMTSRHEPTPHQGDGGAEGDIKHDRQLRTTFNI